jgi:NhaP-type Na+/H+ or K+/H+ antiporter
MALTLLGIGSLVLVAHLLTILFRRTRIPDVLVLIGLGIVLGSVSGLVKTSHFGQVGPVLSTVALVVILFEGGTSIDLAVLRRALAPTLRLTLVTAVVTLGVFAAAGHWFLGLGTLQSLLLGAILCGTSSAVVIPLARGLDLAPKATTLLILESALTDVLCIVLSVGLMSAIETGNAAPEAIAGSMLLSLSCAALIGVVGGALWLVILPLVRRLPSTLFASVAFVFILYGAAELLGLSGAIAALAFGVTLANHDAMGIDRLLKRHDPKGLVMLSSDEAKFFGEVVFLMKTAFFVYLGVSFVFDDRMVMVIASAATVAAYAGRWMVTRWTIDRDITVRDAGVIGVMIPKGLAAAVLASVPVQRGLEGAGVIQAATFGVVLSSISITAILVILLERAPLRSVAGRWFHAFGEGGGRS